MIVLQLVVIPVLSQEGVSARPSSLAILVNLLPNVLFLSQNTTHQDTTLHLVLLSPWAPLGYDSFLDFPCF